MTPGPHLPALMARFGRDERGATLVEFAFVISLVLLMLFGIIDFGRLAYHYVTAEKAMHIAARIAVVRPPACAGVPETNLRGVLSAGAVPPRFGSGCSSGASVCASPATITCSASLTNTTANEIWMAIEPLLPNDAIPANIRISYAYDPALGFLGGPYVPVVTLELQNLTFEFVSPLGPLARAAGATPDPALGGDIVFPSMSVSLPAEDLGHGMSG